MPDYASLEDLTDQYVLCRTLGHSWDEMPQPDFSIEMFRLHMAAIGLRCTRCTCERYDYIGSDLKVATRTYKYPNGYRTIPGLGTRPNLRGEMLRRSLLIQTWRPPKSNNRKGRRS